MNNKKMILLGTLFCAVLLSLYLAVYYSYFSRPESGLRKIYLRLTWETQSQFAGYYVAKDKGMYADEDLDVIIRTSLNNVRIASTVASGSDDFGVIALQNFIMDVDRGFDVVNVAQIYQSFDVLLITRAKDGIETLADLNGKRYASWWGQNDVLLKTLFKKNNIPFEVEIVAEPWSLDLFVDGRADITAGVHINEPHLLLRRGFKPEDLKMFNYSDYGMDFPGDCIIVSRKTLEDDPELVRKFVRVTIRGWKYALAHKEEAVDILMKYANLDRDHEMFQINALHEDIITEDTKKYMIGYHNRESIENVIKMLRDNGEVSDDLGPDDVYTDVIIKQLMSAKTR